MGDQAVVSFSVGEPELKTLPELRRRRHYAVWSYFQSLPGAANRRFVQAWQRRYGGDKVTCDPGEAAYVGVKLWAQAVAAAGTADMDVVRLMLQKQTLNAPSGVLAGVWFMPSRASTASACAPMPPRQAIRIRLLRGPQRARRVP